MGIRVTQPTVTYTTSTNGTGGSGQTATGIPNVTTAPAPDASTVSVPVPAEPAPAAPDRGSSNGDSVFTAADIAAARQQEKDKLYGRIDKMQEQVQTLAQEREERAAAEAEAQRQAEEAERKRVEAETDVRTLLEQKEAEWKQQLDALRAEREQEQAIFAKEREHQALVDYRKDSIAANVDNILPELLDYVTGDNPQEIDASIARLVERSDSIMKNTQDALQSTRRDQRGTQPTGQPSAAGPLDNQTANREFSAADIAAMSPTEYAKYRDAFGVTGKSGRGLFG